MITIGTDPEVFLFSKRTKKFVSAHGMFPGTKHEPYPLGNRGFMQVDGHALEFNTAPASTEEEFVEAVSDVFQMIKDAVHEVSDDLEIALEPVANFTKGYFKALPRESKVLGCDPDFSGLTGNVLSPPDISDLPIRTSSGHIHIGWTVGDDPFDDVQFAQRLSVAQRVTPDLLDVAKDWETSSSVARRQYYGRELAFRPKHYGVELRALDCLWLKNKESIAKVFNTTVQSFSNNFKELAAHAG